MHMSYLMLLFWLFAFLAVGGFITDVVMPAIDKRKKR